MAVLLVAMGCDGGAPPPPMPGEVAVGGAAPDGTGFLALAGDVSLIPGAQGGFHVWLKYRLMHMAEGPVLVRHTATRKSDGAPVLTTTFRQVDVGAPTADGYWELPVPLPAFMCPAPLGVQVRDEVIRYRVEVTELDGTPLGTGEAEATPRCPTGDQAAFCLSICSG